MQERIEPARRRRRESIEFFLGLQAWGTPEQCYEKIVDTIERTGGEAFTGVFSYGGMPYEIAEESLRLFASEVMPELKRRMPREDQLLARAGVGEVGERRSLPPAAELNGRPPAAFRRAPLRAGHAAQPRADPRGARARAARARARARDRERHRRARGGVRAGAARARVPAERRRSGGAREHRGVAAARRARRTCGPRSRSTSTRCPGRCPTRPTRCSVAT